MEIIPGLRSTAGGCQGLEEPMSRALFLGSHGGILSEGGVITFAFWKDLSKSNVGRAGREAGRPRRRCLWYVPG